MPGTTLQTTLDHTLWELSSGYPSDYKCLRKQASRGVINHIHQDHILRGSSTNHLGPCNPNHAPWGMDPYSGSGLRFVVVGSWRPALWAQRVVEGLPVQSTHPSESLPQSVLEASLYDHRQLQVRCSIPRHTLVLASTLFAKAVLVPTSEGKRQRPPPLVYKQ